MHLRSQSRLIAVLNAMLFLNSHPVIGKNASVHPSAVWLGGRLIQSTCLIASSFLWRASIAVMCSNNMAGARENTAPVTATLPIGMALTVMFMADDKLIISYLSTMNIAKQWLSSGLITEADYCKFDTITAEKFGVSARSIWREINLIKLPSDGNMPPTKGGIFSGTQCSTGSADEAG